MKRILFVLSLLMIALNTTFCSKQVQKEGNPLLAEFDTPYGVPPFDKIEAKHYEPAFKYAMSLHNEEIAAILANKEEPTFDNTILELDRSGILLTNISELFGMMCAAMNSEEMQEIQEDIMPRLAAHYDAISMNEELFKRIKVVYDKRNSTDLTAEQIRLTEKMYDGAVRQGALLNKEQKDYGTYIQDQVSSFGISAAIGEKDRQAALGAVMEAMSFYSYGIVRPAYYDSVLSLRFMQDPQSRAILDTMFETIAFDYVYATGLADIRGTMRTLLPSKSPAVASRSKGWEKTINRILERENKSIEKLEN